MVDGERIDGAWCHIWRRCRPDSEYYLDDLIVFADGAITCGERTDLLRNDFPAQIVFAGESYASVLHGYWALSAADASDRSRIRSDRSRIRDAASGREAHDLGGQATHRSDWPNVRLAVMAELLRVKFTQHPELAQVLVSTGDARISYTGLSDSPFWRDVPDGRGRNWMGRLLELTRSELVAQQLLRPENPSGLK
ncbi:NADAR domain-containing protein [Streptomyces sp. NPDC057486]|uniref:NADAR domain-containing protein n=1 Tax=Streptomyces sp. NPDC057486 TaxID=3346145 RepID=UPI0036C98291